MTGETSECPVCGRPFEARSANHVFCSKACEGRARRAGTAAEMRRAAFRPHGFTCRGCGRAVAVTEFGDFRERWCSRDCKERASARLKRARRAGSFNVTRKDFFERVIE